MKTGNIFLLALIFTLCSCSSSKSVNKDRITLSSFNKIVASSGIEIHFTKSSSNYVEIEPGANVETKVKNGTLIFSRKDKRISNQGKSTVYVYGNDIDAIVLSGGSGFNSAEQQFV